ncbi:hypothetical protein [Ancylobacter polymorphus]|uniref:Uncharacterized protein n=1 Tax=Ancylobacter polymorphus TaxID=223390 RepID=A0A9E7D6X0_9HYPH|nr:hypothetical protein [Ancylobacter polymorphus]UOK73987.1 hypothetical protein K9D25_24780 [Ancylobacter polymorphus]
MTDALPPNLRINVLPKTFHWKSSGKEILYWDDADNWEENEYPNQPESTAIFRDSTNEFIDILVRSHVVIANIWFECQYTSYSIQPEGSPEKSIMYFSTGQQLANIVLTEKNTKDHHIPMMIMHSCKGQWGPGWSMPTIPFHGLTYKVPYVPSKSKIVYSGPIGSYKGAPRASININGYIDVELSGVNTFIGPIDVRRGRLIVKNTLSIPDGINISLYDPGEIVLEKGVIARVGKFMINGDELPPGIYRSADYLNLYQSENQMIDQSSLIHGLKGEGILISGSN